MRIARGPGRGGTALVALHEPGDALGGTRWQPLLDRWPGSAIAPDLRGHAGNEVPDGGAYTVPDFALDALLAIERAGLAPAGTALPAGSFRRMRIAGAALPPAADPSGWPILVGHRWSAWACELLASAGRASRLAIVDGLGGEWLTEEQTFAARKAWLRTVLDDPDALAWPLRRPDPILESGFPPVWEPRFVRGVRGRIGVPVLVVETPASVTPVGEVEDRCAEFSSPAQLVRVEQLDDAVGEIVSWAGGRRAR